MAWLPWVHSHSAVWHHMLFQHKEQSKNNIQINYEQNKKCSGMIRLLNVTPTHWTLCLAPSLFVFKTFLTVAVVM